MGEQMSFFDNPKKYNIRDANIDQSRFEGAMVFSAIGDALGWPTEFLRRDRLEYPSFKLPIRDFVKWQKNVGGKWWGYKDIISEGEYSDDTQLTLSVARSIDEAGIFIPEIFAYEELPLWLHYERGGGRSIKTAARSLIKPRANWLSNFYKSKEVDYRNAGANGAAMRTLPIAMVNVNNTENLIIDIFLNAVITHGHPRAILGAILFGLAVQYALKDNGGQGLGIIEYSLDMLSSLNEFIGSNSRINSWVKNWEAGRSKNIFRNLFKDTKDELVIFLEGISKYLDKNPEDYYRFVGALDPSSKGSGLSTVSAAIFLYLKYGENPSHAILEAVNLLGSDTDTIGVFLGAILGARHGMMSIPSNLTERIQDNQYLIKTSQRLYSISVGRSDKQTEKASREILNRRDAYLRILAWEIGLHEMFWDALDKGAIVVHPALGRGEIVEKTVRPIAQHQNYKAKLIRVNFECGQSCVFHSRVKDDLVVSESLAQEIDRALRQ